MIMPNDILANWLFAGAGIVLAGALIFAVWRMYFVRRILAIETEPAVWRDWETTGHITFTHAETDDPRTPGNFLLQVEENRIVELIGGGISTEIRWRKANLAEARLVARRHTESNKRGNADEAVDPQRGMGQGLLTESVQGADTGNSGIGRQEGVAHPQDDGQG
jgi:hypothetical protein